MKKLSIRILYLGVPLLLLWLIFKTFNGKTEDLANDPAMAILVVPFFVSLVLCLVALIKEHRIKTASFGFHFSLLCCISLFLANEFLAEKGQISILEGEKINHYVDLQGKKQPLPFELECLDFKLELYPKSFRARNFETNLRITTKGNSIDQTLSVNHPLKFEGIQLYQTDFGLELNEKYEINLKIGTDKFTDDLIVRFGESVLLSDGSILVISDFSPSWSVNNDGEVITFDPDAIKNPGFLVNIQPTGADGVSGWVVRSNSESYQLDNYKVSDITIWGLEYSVISVSSSPLRNIIIFFGALSILFGLLLFRRISK